MPGAVWTPKRRVAMHGQCCLVTQAWSSALSDYGKAADANRMQNATHMDTDVGQVSKRTVARQDL